MKGKRFTEEQIIGVLKEAKGGSKVIDVCRKYGVSDVTYYKWKAKYFRACRLVNISRSVYHYSPD